MQWMKSIVGLSFLASCLLSCHTTKPVQETNYAAAAKINVQLGLGYLGNNQIERAKEKLLLAMREDPHSAMVHSAMAYFWEKTGDPQLAENYYRRALAIAPQEGELQNNYGTFLCRQKRYSDATRYLEQAAQNKNYLNTAAAYENAGLCALSASQPQQAQAFFTNALAHDSLRERSLWELAKVERDLNKNALAYAHAQRLAQLAKPSPPLLELLIELARKNNDFSAQEQYHQQLRTLGTA